MTSEGRMRILRMLTEGKIDEQEAEELLTRVEEGTSVEPAKAPVSSGGDPGFLRVEVLDGKNEVRVNIPLGLIQRLAPIAQTFIPREVKEKFDGEIDLAAIVRLVVEEGAEGEFVNIKSEDGATVRVYID